MTRIEHLIADATARLRAERGWTQSELATRMRRAGFTWAPNRVAQVETHRRPLSLIEVIGLARVFEIDLQGLLVGDQQVDLPAGLLVSMKAIRGAVDGRTSGWPTDLREDEVGGAAQAEELRRVAATLCVPAAFVNLWAMRAFGRAFMDERDARVDSEGLAKRSAQTKRGHATRALLDEWADWWTRELGFVPFTPAALAEHGVELHQKALRLVGTDAESILKSEYVSRDSSVLGSPMDRYFERTFTHLEDQ